MRVLQISDLHIVAGDGEEIYGVDSHLSLERVLAHARQAAPDVVVATGDLAERADGPSYQRLRDLLRTLELPVLVIPGNHDSVRGMQDHLCDDRILFTDRYDLGEWRMLLLDSRVRGQSHGSIGGREGERLDAALASERERPVAVALHHTPISPCPVLGCQLMDARPFLERLAEHRNVKAIIAGHSHIAADANFRGIRVLTTPSTCAAARHASAESCPDLDDFWASHSFDVTRQGYRIIDLGADGSLSTEVHWVAGAAH